MNITRKNAKIFSGSNSKDGIMEDKEYKFVSVKDCGLIGKGMHGSVYQLNDEQIIKVYHDKTSLDLIKREYELSRKAFVLGGSDCNHFRDCQDGDGVRCHI